jgi:hypothetical protein
MNEYTLFFQTGILLGPLDPAAFNFKGKAVIIIEQSDQ